MADGKIELELTLETGEVVKAFTNVETAATKSADKVEGQFGKKLKDGVVGSFKTIGVAASAAFVAGFAIGFKGIKDAVEGASGFEKALTTFNASLRSAGLFSTETSLRFKNLAAEIQNTTKFTDDQALSYAALSLTYARNADEAEKLTRGAIELAAATGTGVEQALQQLGGTLEGSIGRLGKLGGGFNNLTKAQLESGAALDLVLERFKGLAGAETQTFSGIINQISKTFEDLSKSFGLVIIQSPKIKAALDFVLESVRGLVENFNVKAATDQVTGFIQTAQTLTSFAANILIPTFELMFNVIESAAAGLGKFAGLVVETLSGNFKAAATTLVSDFITSTDSIFNFPISDKVQEFANNLNLAVDAAAPSLTEAGTKAGNAFGGGMIGAVTDTATSGFGLMSAIFDQIGAKATQTIVTVQQLAQQVQGGIIGGLSNAFAALGAALAKGENGFAAFGKAVLGALGGVAIQIGTILVAAGLGWSLIPGFQVSAGAIPQGLLLITLGGALQAIGGGGGGKPSASAGGGVGTSAENFGSPTTEDVTAGIPEPTTGLVVNIQGDVFDSDETGLRIADIIKTNFDRKDVRFA